MPPITGTTIDVTWAGQIAIIVQQGEQNYANVTTAVHVLGGINNIGDHRISHFPRDIVSAITGDYSWSDPAWNFDLYPGQTQVFSDHTFIVPHGSDGNKTVNFVVHYGVTGTWEFGDNKAVSISLALDRIPRKPAPPTPPILSNATPTSVFVAWDAPSSDGGSAITSYLLRRYNGFTTTGSFKEYWTGGLSYLVNDLTPGAVYTFVVYAKNDAVENSGFSDPSPGTSTIPLGGSDIRTGDVWKSAVPYVRIDGQWKIAVPYVRTGGLWKRTN